MQWSKIRLRLRDLLAPDLKPRVDYRLTSYREHEDPAHEVWITVDKVRVFSASCCGYMNALNDLWYQQQLTDRDRIREILTSRESHDACDVVRSFRAYLDSELRAALTSADPIHRALAIVDRRVGKRTLATLRISGTDHSLVRAFYSLRTKAHESTAKNSTSSE